MKLLQIAWNATADERAQARQQAANMMLLTGSGRVPNPPRSPVAQSGSRKVVLTWNAPEQDAEGGSYRVYLNSESSLYAEVDYKCRRTDVAVSAAASSPTYNLFVSRVVGGVESRKVWTQGKALNEAGAPVDPTPPTGWDSEPTGGGGSDLQERMRSKYETL